MKTRTTPSGCCCEEDPGGGWIDWPIEIENGIGWEIGQYNTVVLPDPMEIETPFHWPVLADYGDHGLISRRWTTWQTVARNVWGWACVFNVPVGVTSARLIFANKNAIAGMVPFVVPNAELYYSLIWNNPGFGNSVYRHDLEYGALVPWSYSHAAGTTTLNITGLVQAAIADPAFVPNQGVAFLVFPDLSYTHEFAGFPNPVDPPQINSFFVNPANPGQFTTLELQF